MVGWKYCPLGTGPSPLPPNVVLREEGIGEGGGVADWDFVNIIMGNNI